MKTTSCDQLLQKPYWLLILLEFSNQRQGYTRRVPVVNNFYLPDLARSNVSIIERLDNASPSF